MKRYFTYVAVLALGLVSCEAEFENSIEDGGVYDSGSADFTTYVALGNSLTAGYADGALYRTGQMNSYPNILASKFDLASESDIMFTQPLVSDNVGGLLLGGNKIADTRFVLAFGENGSPAPVRLNGTITTEVTSNLNASFNNMGVPGAKSFHLLAPGYGDVAGVAVGTANPYFARFASSAQTTVLADAMAQNPTFFTLWIGNNDVLGYATSGGTGEFQLNNTDFTSYGENDITDPTAFSYVYNQIVMPLVNDAGADGVLINIPDVSSIPYFNVVPNNALEIDAATAASLTGFFQAVSGVMTQVLMSQGASLEQAQAVASQYAINFSEGKNRFLIDVPVTPTNPLGFRQMTEEELLLLTINQSALRNQGYGSVQVTPEVMQVLGLLQTGGTPTQEQVQTLFGAVNAIDDADVLDGDELDDIAFATNAYNQAIAAIANTYDLGLVDANGILKRIKESGQSFDGGVVTAAFVTGGGFSLDGIHLTPRGNALIANEIIKVIEQKYGANIPMAELGAYGTVTLDQNN